MAREAVGLARGGEAHDRAEPPHRTRTRSGPVRGARSRRLRVSIRIRASPPPDLVGHLAAGHVALVRPRLYRRGLVGLDQVPWARLGSGIPMTRRDVTLPSAQSLTSRTARRDIEHVRHDAAWRRGPRVLAPLQRTHHQVRRSAAKPAWLSPNRPLGAATAAAMPASAPPCSPFHAPAEDGMPRVAAQAGVVVMPYTCGPVALKRAGVGSTLTSRGCRRAAGAPSVPCSPGDLAGRNRRLRRGWSPRLRGDSEQVREMLNVSQGPPCRNPGARAARCAVRRCR
jgi:hypothetical protein